MMNITEDTTISVYTETPNEDKLQILTYKERMAYFGQITPKTKQPIKPLAKVLSFFKRI